MGFGTCSVSRSNAPPKLSRSFVEYTGIRNTACRLDQPGQPEKSFSSIGGVMQHADAVCTPAAAERFVIEWQIHHVGLIKRAHCDDAEVARGLRGIAQSIACRSAPLCCPDLGEAPHSTTGVEHWPPRSVSRGKPVFSTNMYAAARVVPFAQVKLGLRKRLPLISNDPTVMLRRDESTHATCDWNIGGTGRTRPRGGVSLKAALAASNTFSTACLVGTASPRRAGPRRRKKRAGNCATVGFHLRPPHWAHPKWK